ncbi:MAG: hypothetical protein KKA62_03690 [Nanoarchaeota archaeon]|nr:hypothetical protein [Nanoarchaeota archaeon]MBU1644620.1 hypothetical protein [Nanoarchaeota archaeon]MBU1977028.1 hypothetical protein [Nanoarchaeota archaeon]
MGNNINYGNAVFLRVGIFLTVGAIGYTALRNCSSEPKSFEENSSERCEEVLQRLKGEGELIPSEFYQDSCYCKQLVNLDDENKFNSLDDAYRAVKLRCERGI